MPYYATIFVQKGIFQRDLVTSAIQVYKDLKKSLKWGIVRQDDLHPVIMILSPTLVYCFANRFS